ncbi:MAG: zinc-ribbon domain-containing protein, partial [Candidatus Electrothrix sp. GM3_4]|nr:zinc-ribbon domain-containing protein [Candidatus Electrothrix sp. GM3_4]
AVLKKELVIHNIHSDIIFTPILLFFQRYPVRSLVKSDGWQGLAKDFIRFGLALDELYISSITPPEAVQAAIDDRSRLGAIKDMDGFVRMKAGMAMEKAALAGNEAGAGLGLGMGMMMPAMFANVAHVTNAQQQGSGHSSVAVPTTVPTTQCSDCTNTIAADARFCPFCGHQQIVILQCSNCDKNLTAGAKFCSRCGQSTDKKPAARICSNCQNENLPGAKFCDHCGQQII